MNTTIQVRPGSEYARRSSLRKRVHGFVLYVVAAFGALFDPEGTDAQMFAILRERFIVARGPKKTNAPEPHPGQITFEQAANDAAAHNKAAMERIAKEPT